MTTIANAQPSPAPTGIADATIFQLLRLPEARAHDRTQWWWLAGLAGLGWLGATAFLSRYRDTQVAQVLTAVAPASVIFWSCTALALAAALAAAATGRRALAGAGAMVTAFLAGHEVYAAAYGLVARGIDIPFRSPDSAWNFAVARLVWGASIGATCLVAWWLTWGRQPGGPALALGHGDWSVRGRDVSVKDRPTSWARRLYTGYLAVMVLLFLIMQLNVGFGPLRSGNLAVFFPMVVVASIANAAAEELVLRGFVQPAFIAYGGVAAGLWMQGLLFGLLHWGTSVGLLAALPVSMLIGLGSVTWGKAAYETRGLTWVIIAHALVDVAVISAFLVPGG